MKYCIRYTNDFRLYDLVDEIKIKLWEVDMNLLGYTQKIKEEKIKQENRHPISKVDMLTGQTDLFDFI